ncbi:MAG: GH32 C-terminal domain-containing protein [Muribaculaceae bacterium]|nr:GH32 C-terminal domain-containing protein [Muribaculaceae bacterium]
MKRITDRITAALMAGASLIIPSSSLAADGVEVNHLGVNNTLVRVTGDSDFLILPVQESIDDARINVLVDGKIAETIYVRLAQSKTDYTVPFDISKYKGHNVILDIVAPHGRSSIREAKDAVCWEGIHLSDTFDSTDRETKYRPRYHHTPMHGWMNDPNGMFYKDGIWHLYYQHNPYGSKWQNMTWGHSTSSDLVNWKHHPLAIYPDGLGSIFSGSCVIDKENTAGMGKDALIALYTSAGTSQMQSLASSTDNGETFSVYPGNPIITLETEARDPNMFWNEETKEWNLVLAHALDHEMLFFSSPDLKNWTLQSAFGKGIGAQDGVWECPDLFRLPVDGTDSQKWVLLCNLNPGGPFGGSATQYFIGEFDGKKFTADTDADGKIPTKWMDFGKDHYATVSWSDAPDNRRTVIGWMSNWQYAADVPTSQYRSANTLPREMKLFTQPDGQIYLASVPSPELEKMRGKTVTSLSGKSVGKKGMSVTLPSANGGICEITASFDSKNASSVILTLANKSGDKVVMTYDPKKHTMDFDRRESGVVDFSENFPAVTVSPTFEQNGKVNLRIFIDRSSIELFGNDGKFVMTNLVFPHEPYSTLSIKTENGNARIESLKVYSINI